jgi:hypothetical protein
MARYNTFLHETDPVQAIQVVGARYLLTLGQMGADVASTYPLVYSDKASTFEGSNIEASFVYENENPLPRAFIVHQAIQVDTPDDALAYFQGRSIDPRQTVILEADTPAPTPMTAQDSTASISEENPQFIKIETSLAADGYLVLLDTHYPGWVAAVDGKPAAIYRANYIGRAVFVPAGEHVVVFEYRPLSFRVGVGLSLCAIMVLVVIAFVGSSTLNRGKLK